MFDQFSRALHWAWAIACTIFTSSAAVAAENPARDLQVIESSRSASAIIDCFEARGEFASFAHFARNAVDGQAIYRLRFEQTMLEQVRFVPQASGTRVEIMLAAGTPRRDRIAFQAARGDALAACAAPSAPGASAVTGR